MKEVLSIPAGETLGNIKTYKVHAYPYPRPTKYVDSKYVTFRASKGGHMDMLYSIVTSVVIHPSDKDLESNLLHLNEDSKKRILEYIQARKATKFGFEKKDHTYMFYVLKEEESLNHLPRPKGKNTAGHTYYTYDEITSGKEEIVIASKMASAN